MNYLRVELEERGESEAQVRIEAELTPEQLQEIVIGLFTLLQKDRSRIVAGTIAALAVGLAEVPPTSLAAAMVKGSHWFTQGPELPV